jgi:hypothetical protein
MAWSEQAPKIAEPNLPEEVPDEIRNALEALGYVEEELNQ